MSKLHTYAFYALVAPAMALGSGAVLAEQSGDKDVDREQQSSQPDQDASQSSASASQGKQKDQQSSGMQKSGNMEAAATGGMQASNLIGAEVKTTGDEEVGEVKDLVIDSTGQVTSIVVSVGGFLGMGEKEVAIDWNQVTKAGEFDDQDLRIDMTRENLEAAPEYEEQE